ncbi:MAG: aldose 1-epimerase family protein [Lachnospiraceae bacterium]|nr:aldose 1-epimerase family protein [Lachnospiraceae bacterium]
MLYTLQNEDIICEIETHGAELKSIKDKASGREYLWNADPRYWNRTSPVLFPFVGAVKDKQYRHDGRTYNIGQHGFARDMEFAVKTSSDDEILFELSESGETMAKYPFKFNLNIGYHIEGRSVTVLWSVKNTNDDLMYFSIGAHPGFMLPEDNKASFRLYDGNGVPVKSIRNRVFGEGGCVTDTIQVIDTPDGILPITEHLFDKDALVIEDNRIGRVEIVTGKSDTPLVSVMFTSPLVGLWSPPHKNAPFVCIEPWYGRCDKESFDGELSEREYEQKLPAGEEFNASYSISL